MRNESIPLISFVLNSIFFQKICFPLPRRPVFPWGILFLHWGRKCLWIWSFPEDFRFLDCLKSQISLDCFLISTFSSHFLVILQQSFSLFPADLFSSTPQPVSSQPLVWLFAFSRSCLQLFPALSAWISVLLSVLDCTLHWSLGWAATFPVFRFHFWVV